MVAGAEELPHGRGYLLPVLRCQRDQVPAVKEDVVRALDAGVHFPGERGAGDAVGAADYTRENRSRLRAISDRVRGPRRALVTRES